MRLRLATLLILVARACTPATTACESDTELGYCDTDEPQATAREIEIGRA